jgi:AraC-like DNA-binding protein
MDARTRIIITLISSGLHHKLSLHRMAKEVNLSPSRLRHAFKVEVGMTPTKYLSALRLQRVKLLLETTDLIIKEIAYKVGIVSESRLVNDFKKAYGCPPIRYRAMRASVNSAVPATRPEKARSATK